MTNLRNDLKQIGGIALITGAYLLALSVDGCKAINYKPKNETEMKQIEEIRKEHYERNKNRTTLEDFSR